MEVKLHSLITSGLDRGKWQFHTSTDLPQGKSSIFMGYEAGWDPKPVWTLWR